MQIPYGTSAYKRNRGNLPSLELVNMFVEQSRADQKGVILQSRKALAEVVEIGSGPVQATLQKDGVFGGDRFTISGGIAYRGYAPLGVIAGNGVARIVASDIEVLFNAGGPIYSYDGTDFVNVDFLGGESARTIHFANNRFIALLDGTGIWHFSAVLDGRSWDGADYATAENEPDELRDVVSLDGVLILLGAESVEFWGPTGDPELPFTPIQQRVFEQGVIATGCTVVVDNTFFWIGADKITYRNGDVPQAISDDGIVERAAESSTFSLYLLLDERHKLLFQRHDTNTMVTDVTTQQWCEFRSYGRDNFRALAGFGDDETGKIWSFSGYDEGPMERLFTAGAELSEPLTVNNLRITCEVGTTPNLTGDYADPIIEMRSSRDAGTTWGNWRSRALGAQGQYRKRVQWNTWGMFDEPGMLFQGRVTGPVSFRLSGVGINEKNGGRSR